MNKVLWYFYTQSCSGCQVMSPIMDKLSKRIKITKIDCEYTDDVVSKYNVQSVPTVILVIDDKEVARFSGATSEQNTMNFYNQK